MFWKFSSEHSLDNLNCCWENMLFTYGVRFLHLAILYKTSWEAIKAVLFTDKFSLKTDFYFLYDFNFNSKNLLSLLTYSLGSISKCLLNLLGFLLSAAIIFEQVLFIHNSDINKNDAKDLSSSFTSLLVNPKFKHSWEYFLDFIFRTKFVCVLVDTWISSNAPLFALKILSVSLHKSPAVNFNMVKCNQHENI